MLRKNIFVRKDQIDFLTRLTGSVSEHVRVAIDEYIEKRKREKINATISPSKLQKGAF